MASMESPKARILALHGKGTSARIMQAQIKPIMDALEDVAEFEFLEGKVPSAPYHGVERIFPNQPYLAWYETPTAEALEEAYDRIRDTLATAGKRHDTVHAANQVSKSSVRLSTFSPLPTPPATPKPTAQLCPGSPSPRLSSTSRPGSPSYLSPRARGPGITAVPSWFPLTPPEEPVACHAPSRPVDGVICFSQGCVVAAGLLLDHFVKNAEGSGQPLPLRFAILICGGRPFLNLQRAAPHSTPTIKMPSLHIIGKQDAGARESRLLSSMFDEEEREVLELDVGHAPPRRSTDVKLVSAAVRALIQGKRIHAT